MELWTITRFNVSNYSHLAVNNSNKRSGYKQPTTWLAVLR